MVFVSAVLDAARTLAADPMFWLVAGSLVFIIAVSKGAIGGGAAILGVPVLSLIMDPIGAAIVVAPLVSFMDMFTLRAFGPSAWSLPDLKALIPGQILGLAVGYFLFTRVDERLVALAIAAVTLGFCAHWFFFARREPIVERPVNHWLGLLAGSTSGFTTFIAHAGGPPIAIYLQRRGLHKSVFLGTNAAYFTLGNLLKLGPYGLLLAARPETAAAALLLAPLVPGGVWLGVKLHHRLGRDQMFLAVNLLLVVAGGKLLFDSIGRLLRAP